MINANHPDFESRWAKTIATNRIINTGINHCPGTCEEKLKTIAMCLDEEINFLRTQIEQLQLIAPRKIIQNGKTYIWRCPEELIPECLS